MAMLIAGGMGSVLGAVLGAILISVGNQLLLNVENGSFLWLHYSPISGLSTVVLSIAILLMLRFRREGLAGSSELEDVISRAHLLAARDFARRRRNRRV